MTFNLLQHHVVRIQTQPNRLIFMNSLRTYSRLAFRFWKTYTGLSLYVVTQPAVTTPTHPCVTMITHLEG